MAGVVALAAVGRGVGLNLTRPWIPLGWLGATAIALATSAPQVRAAALAGGALATVAVAVGPSRRGGSPAPSR